MASRGSNSDADLERQLEALSPERRALFERLLLEERAAPPARSEIVAEPRDGRPLPVSFAQQRLWFLAQLEPDDLSYNESACVRLSGRLDVVCLERSIGEIVARHEVLRTVFCRHDGAPVQRVLPAAALSLEIIHVAAEAAALDALEGLRRQRFDLSTGPLLRVVLFRAAPELHLLGIVLHHIVADGWSQGVFLDELCAHYRAFVTTGAATLPPLAVQYADYAAWQRRRLRTEDLRDKLAWWKARIGEDPPPIELPLDRARPPVQSYAGERATLVLSPETTAAVDALAAGADATQFMVLLSAFAALLSRVTGERSVIVGAPVANRLETDTQRMIGFFLNTLALRVDLSDDPAFSALLGRVREDCLGAFARQDLPYEHVLEVVRPTRDLSRSPVFQVMLNMLNFPRVERSLPGLEVEVLSPREEVARFDITLYARPLDDGLALDLVYKTQLFERDTALDLLAQLGTLLSAATRDASRKVSDLPLLTLADRERRTRSPPIVATERALVPFEPGDLDRAIHRRFQTVARAHSHTVAVRTRSAELSYAELDDGASALSAGLVRRLGSAEGRVGLMLDDEAETIIAMIAALMAGKTYVALDPTFPLSRLSFMAEDAGLEAVLVSPAHVELARALTAAPALDPRVLADAPACSFAAPPPGALAYLLYTSGSTGQPKAVMQGHGGVLRHIRAYAGALRIGPGDVLSLLPTFGFDAAVMDVYGALLTGATLASFPVRSAGFVGLPEWIERAGVTVLHATPTVFRHLVAQLDVAVRFGGVRLVVLGGEEVLATDLDACGRFFPSAVFVNLHGSTECSLSFLHPFEPGAAIERRSVPLGTPVDGVTALLVDERGRPTDVRGEVAIRSDAIALGYWRRPAETAARFVADPTGGGRRIYLTGDIARALPDGTFQFLERADSQVKVRGNRIEIGEIEAALLRMDDVRQAAAALRPDRAGDPAVVAYVVGSGRGALAPEVIVQRLRGVLPDFMVPGAIVVLDALPTTPTGKVDRRALPAPTWTIEQAPDSRAANSLEATVAGICGTMLGRDRLGLEEDFFLAGGHSLLATQVVSRIRADLGVELPLRAVFEAPTPTTLARRVQELLGQTRDVEAMIVPVPRDGPLPLSFAQERLWFVDQMAPGNIAYVVPIAVRIRGALRRDALRAALEGLCARHEVLRTRFANVGGRPAQIVQPPSAVALPEVDLSGLTPPQRDDRVRAEALAEAAEPFALSAGPPVRFRLLQLAGEEHVLLVTLHHVVSDAWSAALVIRDALALYEATVARREAALTPLTVQYADYAVWQRTRLTDDVLARELSYWKQQLDGVMPLALPTDRPRPPIQTFAGARERVEIPPELRDALVARARAEGATLYMTLLAGLGLVLSRWSGQTDVAIGSSVANRMRPEIEPLVGFFVNTVVMRMLFAGDPSLREIVAQAREVALAAYQHQEVPFERVVDVVHVQRDPSHNPLFQVLLILQNVPTAALSLRGLELELVELPRTAAKFDLTISLTETPAALDGYAEYNTDLFDAATIARLIGHFVRALEAIARAPDRRTSAVGLLTEVERTRAVAQWNATRLELPAARTVHELFEAEARRDPGATAVIHGSERLTYSELDRAANGVAGALRSAGVGPERVVAVLVERSLQMVVAVLGVLKAGGAYVPLDPTYPPERLARVLRASGAAVLLTQRSLHDRGTGSSSTVIDLDDLAPAETLDPSSASPQNLAYLVYTSGSTGEPKGVMVTHSSLIDYVRALNADLEVGRGDVYVHTASLAFSSAARQLFLPLCNGGALLVVGRSVVKDPLALLALARESGATLLDLVPSAVRAVLDAVESLDEVGRRESMPSTLRLLATASEAHRWEYVRRWAALRSRARLVNMYGQTETTGIVTTFPVDVHTETAAAGIVPIGRPRRNATAYVLDGGLEPAPVGVAGDLYVGGPALARGYHERPGETAESFVPDPFGAEPGARLYRTGDRARYLADGTIAFVGRADHQVKVRGHRVELGDVEVALVAHARIRDAAVVVRGRDSADPRLLAYVVSDGAPIAVEELRSHLASRLPQYMLPSAIVTMEVLPRLPSGKVDRPALPEPAADAPYRREPLPPRTPVEEVVAGIWAEVLKLERVGVDDDFFAELGGHSLLATQVVARARRLFGIDLSLDALFEAPTVAGLSGAIEGLLERGSGPIEAPIAAGSREGPLPLSFAQERFWFLDQLSPGSAAYNVPAALRIAGPLDIAAMQRAFSALVARHETLRTTFGAGPDGAAVQRVAPPPMTSVVRIEERLGSRHDDQDVEALLAADARTPFDLRGGPLIRVLLVRLARDEHVLSVTLHHTITDGWSVGVLVRDLCALYDAFATERPSPLPPLSIQYGDFALWQRSGALSERIDRELSYWRDRLASLAPLDLPTDRPRPAVQSDRGASVPVELPAPLVESLRQITRRAGATLYITLLAGWQALLSRITGQVDIAVGSPIANRTQRGTEDLIGLFVNTLVMRGDLSGGPTFVELVGRVRKTALEAYAHREVPLERLVDAVAPERDMSRTPLFQVLFTLQNQPRSELLAGGLEFRRMPRELVATKFDLTLILSETDASVRGSLEYATDLFDRSTAEQLARHFVALLEAAARAPDVGIDELDMLGAAEREHVLRAWNDTTAPIAFDLAPREMEGQAAARPHALAVRSGDRRLSHGELHEQAARLAARLRRAGVGLDQPVGLYLPRSPEMVVAMLATWKAGGAYVPLDPSYPAARIAHMASDSGARVVLTDRAHRDRFVGSDATVLLVDEHDEATGAPAPPSVELHPEALAYVIYTSGSTGEPKGTLVTHAGLASYLSWAIPAYGLAGGGGSAVLSSLSFDLTVTSLLAPLVAGGWVELPPDDDALASLETVARSEGGYALLKLTPSHLTLLSELVAPERAAGLARCLVVGGEALLGEQLSGWFDHAPETRIVNEYGPTETVVGCCVHEARRDLDSRGAVPIGRPIANTALYVLDARLEPVPPGAYGELFIGGAGVARGYHARPDLTARRFVPDPFSTRPGARMYRTGDRCRHRADGTLEFAGRLDDQVKIRGHRIELGEIEAVLRRHPQVRDAAVLAVDGEAGERRLVAWVVADAVISGVASDLTAWLGERLPAPMVPAAFVAVDALPLTPNGKVDRRQLLALPSERAADEHIEPSPGVEATLAEIWRKLLRVERVGATDDFFALGGDSILNMQLVWRARRVGLSLDVKDVFENPTLRALAVVARMEQELPAATGRAAGTWPLSPIQRWFVERDLCAASHFNQALCLEVDAPLSSPHLEEAVAAVVDRHDALRLRFSFGGAGPVEQTYAAGEDAELVHRVDLSAMDRDAQAAAFARATAGVQASLDPARGPLLRVLHVDLGPERGARLVLVAHHLVVDGVSWRILLEDIASTYTRRLRGEAPDLPPRGTSYGRWCEAAWEHARTQKIQSELGFWREVAVAGAAVALVPDLVAADDTFESARTLTMTLDPGETRALVQDAARVFRARPEEMLLAASALAWRRCTGQSALAVELEGHGREGARSGVDVSRTVGWFTALFPVVIPVESDAVEQAIRSAKDSLARIPDKGVGYGLLRYGGGEAQRELSSLRRPQVSFNYHGQLDAALATTGFRPARESPGPTVDPRSRRAHVLDIGGAIRGDALRLSLTYGSRVVAAGLVERLRDELVAALRAMVTRARSSDANAYASADFPLAKLPAPDVDALVRRCAARTGSTLASDPIEDVYPLSPLQEGLLFHALQTPDSAVYTTPIGATLEGDLDAAAFRRAWGAVMARHSILRTSFEWEGLARPMQVVHRRAELPWTEISLEELPAAEQDERLEALVEADRARAFDLRSPPPMRMTLVRRSAGSHAFVWTVHHLLLDGWSTARVIKQVMDEYEAIVTRRAVTAEPAFRYRDYIAWIEATDTGGAERFFRERLRGFSSPTPVGPGGTLAHRKHAARRVGEQQLQLDESLTARLTSFARDERVTAATLVQAAWAIVLGRHAESEDVLFGVTVSGRPGSLAGVESGVGLFINAMPMRVGVAAGTPVRRVLAELRAEQVALKDFEHVPLVAIQGWSEIRRGLGLFDSLVVVQNFPLDEALRQQRAGIRVRPMSSFVQTNYPLVLVGVPGDRLLLRLRHDETLVSRDQAIAMLQQLQGVLAQVSDAPDADVGVLTLVTPGARAVLPDPTASLDEPWYEPIPTIIVRIAAASPEAVAVRHRGRSFTYADLVRAARSLASTLVERGVRRGDIVAVTGPQSFGTIAAMIGILMSGAAFSTIDSKLPPARVELMLREARVRLVVSLAARDRVPLETLELDPAGPWPAEGIAADLPEPSPDDPAYVFFTSGTTGVPKGVLGCHKGMSHFLAWQRETFGIRPDDRCGQLTGLSFNVLLRAVFLPLTTGATLCLPDDLDDLSAERVLPWLARERITLLHAVPALTQTWLAGRAGIVSEDLRYAFFAGEPLVDVLVRSFRAAFPRADVVLLYGQTETTMAKCFSRLPKELPPGAQPVGKALPHAQALVLGARQRPCGISEPGEVAIRTPFRTLGYINAPEDNRAKFIPNPFRDDPRDLVYLTGDRGYHLPDGSLQLIGRTDDQLKIRGVRVECAEVAAALAEHPRVSGAFAMVRPDVESNDVLVAYVVPADPLHALEPAELTSFLAAQLPAAMIPSSWVFLAVLPVNPNGKVDRNALPVPTRDAPRAYAAPSTPLEEGIALIWQEVLGVDRVGVRDDFFTLGGHSLLATRVVSRLQAAFGVDVSVRELFESPTVAGVARAIAKRRLDQLGDDELEALLREVEEEAT